MKMKNFTTVIKALVFQLKMFLSVSFLILFSSLAIFPQNGKVYVNLSDTPIKNVDSNQKTKFSVEEFVKKIFWSSNVPAGIIWAKNEDTYQEFPHDLQGLTIREALNLFVKEKPEYSWEETDEIINVFPKSYYSIMDSRIPEFRIDAEYPWNMDDYLLKTDEFQIYLNKKNLISKVPDSGFLFIGAIGRPNPRAKRSIHMKKATVREILNEIILLRGYGTWSYREYDLNSDDKNYQMFRLEL